MVAAEAEEVGKFVGVAIATPTMQMGTLISVIGYISWSQPYLALLIVGIILPQALIAIGVQPKINRAVKDHVMALRSATDQIVEDTPPVRAEQIVSGFDTILEARRKVFFFKLSSKLALNTINALGTAGILLLGGWLVVNGRTDIGTVVAALTGLARISQPWRQLIAFYRTLSATDVEYELLIAALADEPVRN